MGEVGSDKLAEDGVHVRVHDPVEGHNGYSPNGLIVSAVINDRENTKDDKPPEDVLKLMEYVPVDEKGDTMEDLVDHMEKIHTDVDSTKQVDDIHDTDTLDDLVEHVDDEVHDAETKITVKSLQHKENLPMETALGEVHGEGTGDIALEKIQKTLHHKKHKSKTSLDSHRESKENIDFEYFFSFWPTS